MSGMRRIAGLALVTIVAGCAPVRVKPPEPARGQFAPERREELWARAKSILEAKGYGLSTSDRPGLLRTNPRELGDTMPCPGGPRCIVRQSLEIVLLPTGEAAVTIHREYYFVRARRGDVLWIYYDRQRQRWFLQGQVE